MYILCGQLGESRPKIYIGQGDVIKHRIDKHYREKDFWTRLILFVVPGRLNSAHSRWLEYALIKKAIETDKSNLDNLNQPKEPNIAQGERAELHVLSKEICLYLILREIRLFE